MPVPRPPFRDLRSPIRRLPPRTARIVAAALLAGWAAAVPAGAAEDEAEPADPEARSSAPARYELTVRERRPVTASSTMVIPPSEFELQPFESGGQLLEAVPGLLTAQHTGGGKAEQYFIRGFDADHGTDLAVFFDDVPANLRSHAHGQGFLDLHFVIPELVEEIRAAKGPYFARYGDFATAAAVEYVPLRFVEQSSLKVEYGEFDTFRSVALVSPRSGLLADPERRSEALLAAEVYHTNGPYDDNENLWRYTLYGSAGADLAPDWRLSGHVLGYWGSWHASGLIPNELVSDDVISRFGSLDPSEGGDTTRIQSKLRLDWTPSPTRSFHAEAWAVYYQLDLYSNFTYYLVFDDPAVGDGIVQRDDRVYAGGDVEFSQAFELPADMSLVTRAGVQTRTDHIRVKLGEQTRRNVRDYTNDDRIDESSLAPWVEAEWLPLEWVRFVGGLRFEWFHYDVDDRIGTNPSGTENDAAWLPKANLVLSPFSAEGPLPSDLLSLRQLEVFLNFGEGFHSNDARDVVANPSESTIPLALGWEVGLRTELLPGLAVSVDYWWLSLQSELVFVGDEGGTEPSPRTQREGIEASLRWSPWSWIYLRGDVAYSSAHYNASGAPVPQAPRLIASGALGLQHPVGLAAELSVKHLGERYATEDDYSLRLQDYTILNLGVRLRREPFEVGLAIENLTDEDWRSSEFYYESRPIAGGPASEDFHFTAGNPRNVRGWVRVAF